MDKICRVYLTRFADKQLQRLPQHIQLAYNLWMQAVEFDGIRKVRAIPGYHDEPLSGTRRQQRSVRLNRAYRVIYEESEAGDLILIAVQEVNKHDY